MYKNFINRVKNIIVIQLVAVVSVIILNVHENFLIRNDFLFTNSYLLIIGISIVFVFYLILISVFLKKSFLNLTIFIISFILYLYLVFYLGIDKFFIKSQSDDYGVGIIVMFITLIDSMSLIGVVIIEMLFKNIKLFFNKESKDV